MSQKDCDPNLPFVQYVIFVFLETISGISSIVGNAIVLYSIAKTPSLRTISNMYIASLALADFSVGVFMSPMYIALTTIKEWVNASHLLYRLENFLWIQTLVATTLSLCAVSIDRYLAVTRVFRYHQIVTRIKSIIVIVCVWLVSFSFASASLIITTADDASALWVSCLVFTVILPVFVIGYCYYKIFQAARRQVKMMRETTKSVNATETLRNRKTAVTIGIVIGVFLIMFTPNFVFSWLEMATRDPCDKMIVYRYWLWAIFVVFANSAINPWIYALRMNEFKAAFRRVLFRNKSVRPMTLSLKESAATVAKDVNRLESMVPIETSL